VQILVAGERLANGQRGAHGAFRVVFVRDRGAEQGHDRVADELLDSAGAALELGPKLDVVRVENRAHLLRIELLGPAREADQVGEEDGHDLALLTACRRLTEERGATGKAETRPARIRLAAGRTGRHVARF
jgi:hypothetical protein